MARYTIIFRPADGGRPVAFECRGSRAKAVGTAIYMKHSRKFKGRVSVLGKGATAIPRNAKELLRAGSRAEV